MRHRPATVLLGMTLVEVVIAIGVIAFAVPIILAATGSAGNSRSSAEAETRSTWIAREVQRHILLKWSAVPATAAQSFITAAFPFPTTATSTGTLIFDNEGKFLTLGSPADLTGPSPVPDAAFIATLDAQKYTPATGRTALALVRLNIIHPAKAKKTSRSTFRYNLITSTKGTL